MTAHLPDGYWPPEGRESVTSHATDVLSDAHRRVVCLVGEAGIGKSTVWRAVADRMRPAVRAQVRCDQAETTLGLTVIADLIGKVADTVGTADLPPLQQQVLRAVRLEIDPGALPVPLEPRVIGATFVSLLTASARRASTLIAIDDMQWCDPDSYLALAFAARRSALTAPMVGWLLARRPVDDRGLAGERVIPLPPLDAEAIRRVIATHLGVRLSPPTLRAVAETSGGNPMFALELARGLPADADAAALRLSPSLRQLIGRRLGALPRRSRAALLDLAVRAGVGRAYDRLADLDPAFEQGIVTLDNGRIEFSHPLLAAGVLERTPPGGLALAHRRAAGVSTDPVQRARHLAAAAAEPDDALAAQLDEAAELAAHRGDAHGAWWLAERALNLTEASPPPWDRLAAATNWAVVVGHPRAPELAGALVAQSKSGRQRASALLLLSNAEPDMTVGLAAVRDALLERDLDDELRGSALCQLGAFLVITGQMDEGADTLQQGLAMIETGTPTWAGVVSFVAMTRRISGRPCDERSLVQAAEMARAGRSDPPLMPLINLGLVAMYDDRHDQAETAYRDAIEIGDITGDENQAYFHLAELELRTGHLAKASEIARTRVALHDGQERASYLWVVAMAAAWRGDEAECRTAAAEACALSHAAADELFWVAGTVALGFLELTLHNYEAAWAQLDLAASTMERQGFGEPSCFPVLPIAAEAAIATGRLRDAEHLIARLDTQATALHSRWAHAGVDRSRAHLADAKGDDAQAIERLDKADDGYSLLCLPLEQARTLLKRGQLQRRRGQRRAARIDLENARAVFDEADAAILRADAAAEIARIGGRKPTAPGELTPSERQVAEHIARGLTNIQTATALHLSVKTVEAHLSRAYHKLDVHSRVELANRLNRNA